MDLGWDQRKIGGSFFEMNCHKYKVFVRRVDGKIVQGREGLLIKGGGNFRPETVPFS